MIILKKINYQDADKEYKALISIQENENGFTNPYFNISKEEFINEVIPLLMEQSNGNKLNTGYVY